MNVRDHGDIGTARYMIPSAKPRGFWIDRDAPLNKEQWAFVRRSECGKFWEVGKSVGGFASEEDALKSGREK